MKHSQPKMKPAILSSVLGSLLLGAALQLHEASAQSRPVPAGSTDAQAQGLGAAAGQSATLLADGQWLVLGGAAPAQLLKADGSTAVVAARPVHARSAHSATLLPDGRVLILGGQDAAGVPVIQAESYDPQTARFKAEPLTGLIPRSHHSATVLSDGRLLVTGGVDARGRALYEAELWNPASGAVERFNVRLQTARLKHLAALLPSDAVLLWGGMGADGRPAEGAEIFDRASERFRGISVAEARALAQGLDGAEPPAIAGSTPPAEAYGVSGQQTLVLRFNKRMAMASLNSQSITLVGPTGAEAVKVAPVEQGVLVFIQPLKELLPGSRYTLFVNGAMDNAQQPLPLSAIGFDTQALMGPAPDAGASPGAAPPPVATPDAPNLPAAQPTPDSATPAAAETDDELFIPGAAHRRGDWFSGRAGRAREALPRNALLRQALHGTQEWEERVLSRKRLAAAPQQGNNLKATASALPQPPAEGRLTWGDVNAQVQEQARAAAQPAATGPTALTGQVLRLNGKPLANVTLSINGHSARTDSQGEFMLSGIPAGSQVLRIDGRSANRADATYGVFDYQLRVQAGRTNTLPFVVWMPKLDKRHAIRIDSPTRSAVTLRHPLMPGFEVTLPAGTVIRDVDGRIVTEIGITPLPVDQTPFPMPYFGVPLYYTLQPGGAVIQGVDGKPRAATVRYPNYTSLGAGAPMRLFDYDAGSARSPGRGWYVYAQARVSADGQRLESDQAFQIYQFGATSASSGGPAGGGGGGDGCGGGGSGDGGGGGGWGQDSDAGGGVCGGDPVDLSTGHFAHIERDLFLPDVVPIDIRRTYRTLDNNGSTSQYVRAFGVGTTHPYENYLYLPPPTYSEIQLVMPNGRTVRFPNVNGTACCYVSQIFQNTDASGDFHRAYVKFSSSEGAVLILYFKDGRRWAFQEYTARLVWMEDANGNRTYVQRPTTTSYASRVVSPNGRHVSFSYNSNGLISQITDNIGRSFSYTYDSGRRLTEVTDPANNKRIYTWDTTNNRILSIRDPNGHTMVANEYNAAGRVVRQTLADGSTFQYAYTTDANGRIMQTDVTDRRGTVRRVQFDASGQVVSNTMALGLPEQQVTSYEVVNGLTLAVTDALNRRTAFGYDAAGNVTQVTQLAGTAQAVSSSVTYDAVFNRPLTVTDANGHTTTMAYDGKGNLVRITDALGNASAVSYDSQGKPLTLTDALGHATTLGYDGGDLSDVTDPLGRRMRYFTDTVGRVLSTVDSQGNRSRQDWDSLNRLLNTTDPLGGVTSFSYDANGHLLSHSDPKGNTTTYAYNSLGAVQSVQDALGLSESGVYEPGGNIRQRIDRKGQLGTVTHDALGRVATVGFGASSASPTAYRSLVELTWDKANRLTQIVDKTCANPQASPNCASVVATSVITRTYDSLDRLVSEVTPQGEVAYTYDNAGRRTSMTVKNGPPGNQTLQPAVTYSYDDADRLTGITQAAGSINAGQAQSIVLAYDAAGRRTQTTLANGSTVAYGYDAADQLTSMVYRKADGTLIGDLSYEYDANGRRTGMGGSLARVNLPAADVTDAAYDANNRMTAWGGRSYSYDDNGNLVGDGSSTYQWDERDQLRGISSSAGSLASFQYDSQGRRTGKTIGAATTGFLYDGDSFVQELLGTGNTAGVKAHLLTGGIDETFLRMEGNDGANRHSFLSDGNNNTLRLLDASQAKLVDYSYEAYGATTADAAHGNAQQYTGRENDNPGDPNGLYYYRARYYLPGCARFISEDPIGWASGQVNNYAYVGGDPVRNTDPSGEIAPLVAMGLGALFGGGLDLAVQLIRNDGNWSCVNWVDVGMAAASSISLGGRLGYKATLEGLKPLAQTMTKREAFDLRNQIRRDYRVFGKLDDFLKRRDRPFESIADPRESFARSNPAYDLGIAGSGAIGLGSTVGRSQGNCR
jgi:RHS repeat-associated protein